MSSANRPQEPQRAPSVLFLVGSLAWFPVQQGPQDSDHFMVLLLSFKMAKPRATGLGVIYLPSSPFLRCSFFALFLRPGSFHCESPDLIIMALGIESLILGAA